MTILLVEDNPDEEELALIAFKKSGVDMHINVARDGQEAVDYLFAQGDYQARVAEPLPMVVFLDINLPKLSGLEVLKILRNDERTKLVPVVLLTSSDEEQDMIDGYSSGANSYIRKPFDFNDFLLQIKILPTNISELDIKYRQPNLSAIFLRRNAIKNKFLISGEIYIEKKDKRKTKEEERVTKWPQLNS